MLALPSLHYKKIALLTATLLFGCAQHNNTGSDLLASPLNGGRTLPPEEIAAIESSASTSSRKASNPIAFLGQLWPGYFGQQHIIHTQTTESVIKAILIMDGVQDDSIRTYRFDIELIKNKARMWSLKTVTESWRCWDERGHQDFSIKPCA